MYSVTLGKSYEIFMHDKLMDLKCNGLLIVEFFDRIWILLFFV